LIIPGGRGIHALKNNKDFLEEVKRFSQKHLVVSVCTGSFVLAWAGLLSGKKATTHYLHKNELKKFCTVIPKRVVVDGNIITAEGWLLLSTSD
jgi:cyclohexyl-isocyanide hydratase